MGLGAQAATPLRAMGSATCPKLRDLIYRCFCSPGLFCIEPRTYFNIASGRAMPSLFFQPQVHHTHTHSGTYKCSLKGSIRNLSEWNFLSFTFP